MITETTFKIARPFCFDYSRRALLTELAREAGVNHRTARLHVDMLVRLGILEVEEKGRLLYVQPTGRNQFYRFIAAVENYFSFSDRRPEMIKLHERFNGDFCIVFGSFASREETEVSDIDILCDREIEVDDFFHRPQFFLFDSFKEIPDRLFREILKKHVIIKGTDSFIEEVRRRYG